MARPVIITVAITGALPRKKDNPSIPVTPEQQIESTHEAFEAGAALVHVHVRNPDESPSSDPELYGRVQEGVHKHCPGMIVQFSTGGRGREQSERGAMLYLKPDMASLATGSVNFDFLRSELREGAAESDVGRRRHRPLPMGSQPVVPRERRPLPNGTRGNLRASPDRLAASNAELVKKIVDDCGRFERRPATAAEAREILGLRPST